VETSGEADALWSAYKSTGDPDLRNRLVLRYSPLVKYVAGRVGSNLPRTVDTADLVSEGVIGLMDAIEKFEPGRGLQFQTHAVPRIRGAIIDSLRAADWVPRAVRAKVRAWHEARAELEAELGRTASDQEVADRLEVDVNELRDLVGTAVAGVASLDELGGGDDVASFDEPLDDEMTDLLLPALDTLSERDMIIVALYYYEGLTLAEIGLVLDVTESRVSQLHTRLSAELRARLGATIG
jgi:RNA polymerase sigma factor for flagellar operon FliA